MFDKEAVEALQKADEVAQVRDSVVGAITMEHGLVGTPNDYQLHDIEFAMDHRRRARGVMETSAIQSFSAYTKDHSEEGAIVFVAPDMTATAVLNLGVPDKPGQADNLVKLKPRMTAAYLALRDVANGHSMGQMRVAEFFEDWAGYLDFYDDAAAITPAKAIAAVRRITIESLRKLESEEKQLSASKSTFENVQATSVDPIPTTIYFKCVPFKDFNERTFVLRLGILTGGDKPAITLRITKIEEHEEEMATELVSRITESFYAAPRTIPVTLGTYTKTK